VKHLTPPVDQIPGPSPEDRERIHDTLSQVSGIYAPNFGDRDLLEVWLLEQRMKAERLGLPAADPRDVSSGHSDGGTRGRNRGARYRNAPAGLAWL
jgi:hypothetical protein